MSGWRSRVAGVVRGAPVVSRAAYAVADRVVGSSGAATVRGGDGVDADRSPLVLLVVLGATAERVETLARRLAELQALGEAFRAMFLLDAPEFAAVRLRGYVAEYVPSSSPPMASLTDRLRECHEEYAPAAVLVLPDASADEQAPAVVAAVAAGSPAPETGRLAAVRRFVDRS